MSETLAELEKRIEEQTALIENRDNEYYFKGYGSLQRHQLMIADTARTGAHRHSILKSYERLSKKSVLDVGCGTGILSLFACKVGASHVYAVDASDAIRYAEMTVSRNECSDKIHFTRSKIEDFRLPEPEEKVDAIISEWMGYCLFSEWMLPSVIFARDRFLKEGGLMFPNKAKMCIALVTETKFLKERAFYWQSVPHPCYKASMEVLGDAEYRDVIYKIAVHEVNPTDIVSGFEEIISIDLHQIPLEDTRHFMAEFKLTCSQSCDVYGFCLWFTTSFPQDVQLDTSPFGKPTHWDQTVLYVPPFALKEGDIDFHKWEFLLGDWTFICLTGRMITPALVDFSRCCYNASKIALPCLLICLGILIRYLIALLCFG